MSSHLVQKRSLTFFCARLELGATFVERSTVFDRFLLATALSFHGTVFHRFPLTVSTVLDRFTVFGCCLLATDLSFHGRGPLYGLRPFSVGRT